MKPAWVRTREVVNVRGRGFETRVYDPSNGHLVAVLGAEQAGESLMRTALWCAANGYIITAREGA